MTRKVSGKITTDDFRSSSIELNQEELQLRQEMEKYCDVYREIAELIGVSNTQKLWKRYHGLTLQFPQRLYSYHHTKEFIRHHMDNMKPKEIATYLGLTDRRVRQIMKELRDLSQ